MITALCRGRLGVRENLRRDGENGLAVAPLTRRAPARKRAAERVGLSPHAWRGEEPHTAFTFSRRYSVGVTPVTVLKARLNGPSDWKPASMAMVMTGTSSWAGSASAALASSIRCSFRNTLKLR